MNPSRVIIAVFCLILSGCTFVGQLFESDPRSVVVETPKQGLTDDQLIKQCHDQLKANTSEFSRQLTTAKLTKLMQPPNVVMFMYWVNKIYKNCEPNMLTSAEAKRQAATIRGHLRVRLKKAIQHIMLFELVVVVDSVSDFVKKNCYGDATKIECEEIFPLTEKFDTVMGANNPKGNAEEHKKLRAMMTFLDTTAALQ